MAAIANLRLADYAPSAEINITPLIDVMLALMLIFMLTAPVLTQRIPMPLSTSPDHSPMKPALELDMDSQGQISRNGFVLSPLEVQAELAALGSKEGAKSLQVHPDANTSHQALLELLGQARWANVNAIALEMPSR